MANERPMVTLAAGRIICIGNRWGIQLHGGTDTILLGPNGFGMSKSTAERILDAIELRDGERKSNLNKEQ